MHTHEFGSAVVTIVIVMISATTLWAKRKDDTLVLANGDRLVGEIKELAQGELHFKTDYILNEFHVEWRQVLRLESQDVFRVYVKDGRRLTGAIARQADGRFTIAAAAGVVTLSSSDVIGMLPIESSIWAQLTGQVNSGFSYTSGDSQRQFSASGSVGYIADRYAFDLSGSSSFSAHSSDGGTASTSRNTADLVNEFPIAPQWFAVGLVDLLNSAQQDLQLRTTAGGAIGRWLVRSEHTRFAAFGGLVYTREKYALPNDGEPQSSSVANNLEAVASLQYGFHRFKTTDIDSKFTVFPSLSTTGRVRVSVAPTLNVEIAHNLNWTFTLYENYDSRPPVNANKNDVGITNSIGWKF